MYEIDDGTAEWARKRTKALFDGVAAADNALFQIVLGITHLKKAAQLMDSQPDSDMLRERATRLKAEVDVAWSYVHGMRVDLNELTQGLIEFRERRERDQKQVHLHPGGGEDQERPVKGPAEEETA